MTKFFYFSFHKRTNTFQFPFEMFGTSRIYLLVLFATHLGSKCNGANEVELTTDETEDERSFEEKNRNFIQRIIAVNDSKSFYESYYNVSWNGSPNCSADHFNCGEYCIPPEFVCDGVVDCFNISEVLDIRKMRRHLTMMDESEDEKNCPWHPCGFMCTPSAAEFKGEKFCVPFREVCDSLPHCSIKYKGHQLTKFEKEDEDGCYNMSQGHPSNSFKCKISGKILSRQAVCDFDLGAESMNSDTRVGGKIERNERIGDYVPECSILIAEFSVDSDFVDNISCLIDIVVGKDSDCLAQYGEASSSVYERTFFTERYTHCDPQPLEKFTLFNFPQVEELEKAARKASFNCYLNEGLKKKLGREEDVFHLNLHGSIYLILRDHSDEENCPDARFNFPSIYPEKSSDCGHYFDCGDGTCGKDQIECQNKYRENKCHSSGFYCYQRCVQPCDGLCDCWNCEDEVNCSKNEFGCLKNQFFCNSTRTCLAENTFPDDEKVCLALEFRAKKYARLGSGQFRIMSPRWTLVFLFLLFNIFLEKNEF